MSGANLAYHKMRQPNPSLQRTRLRRDKLAGLFRGRLGWQPFWTTIAAPLNSTVMPPASHRSCGQEGGRK